MCGRAWLWHGIHSEDSVLHHSVIIGLWPLAVPLGLTVIATGKDLRSREIPDWIPLGLVAWGLLDAIAHWSGIGWWDLGLGLVIGVASGIILFASGGFGGGDAKLVAALGAALGWKGLVITLPLMAFAGGALAVVAKLRGRRDFAYGPAITVGVAGYALLCIWKIWLISHQGVAAR